MSAAADQARDLLADPPIGVEVWGPVVDGLLGELVTTDADLAKARNVIERVREWEEASKYLIPDYQRIALARILDEAEWGEGA